MSGVYISYPFCAQKCTYCNFASGVFPRGMEERYVEALKNEIHSTEWPWIPETVYLGGGTPSQFDPVALKAVLSGIPGQSKEGKWREATMEAAPGGLTRERLDAWVAAGINRVSFGVQSFISRELSRTGRKHTAETVRYEIGLLREYGITSINVDLISGLPGQTLASWSESLDWIERLEVPHVSVYMLEVDEDSRLGLEILNNGPRYGASDVPDDDGIAEFYEVAVDRLAAVGIPRYEISNFARPGFESAHNRKYWKREPYLGFGADAHSFDGESRWQNPENASDYVAGFAAPERVPADAKSERLFLGLRLSEGIAGDGAPYRDAMERFTQDGLLERAGDRIRLTSRGVLLSNEVFAEFL